MKVLYSIWQIVAAILSLALMYVDRVVLLLAFWVNIPNHKELNELPYLRKEMINRLLIYGAILLVVGFVYLIKYTILIFQLIY